MNADGMVRLVTEMVLRHKAWLRTIVKNVSANVAQDPHFLWMLQGSIHPNFAFKPHLTSTHFSPTAKWPDREQAFIRITSRESVIPMLCLLHLSLQSSLRFPIPALQADSTQLAIMLHASRESNLLMLTLMFLEEWRST